MSSFEMMRHAFPGLQADIEDIVAAQDTVAARVRFRGTHAGKFLGFAATGQGDAAALVRIHLPRVRASRQGMMSGGSEGSAR
jgi:predicted ester cyclase